MGSSYEKFARDVAVIGISSLLIALSRLVLLPLLTKTLGAHDYGIWAQVQVTVGLLMAFVSLGLPFAMTRFLAARTRKEDIRDEFYSVLSFVFLVTLIASLILIGLAETIAEAFFDGATEIVQITGFIILVWSLDMVFLSLFRAFRQMYRYSFFMIADVYVQLAIIAYLVLNGHGLFSVVLTVLIVRGAMLLILLGLIRSQIGFQRPRFSKLRVYLRFGLPTIPANISHWIVASSDRFVISYILGVTSVGFYSAGYWIGCVPLMVVEALGFVLSPTVSKLYDEGKIDEVRTHLSYSLKYFLALAIPFIFGAALLSEEVLTAFSTPEIGAEGHTIVPLVAMAMLLWGIYAVVVHVLVVVNKTTIMGMSWALAALVNLGLNIAFVPHFGITGAAVATLIAYALAVGITIYYSRKEFKFSVDWAFILKSLVASSVMAPVVWKIAPAGTLNVVLTVLAGTTIYVIMLLLLRGFKKEEFQFLKSLLPRQ